jgi:preprotein translocase subunit SecA
VALQLQGRSGRQGAFGSTRSLPVRSDRWLAGLEYGHPGVDPAGRVCWEGPELERQLRRRREAAQREASSARALLLEYAAVLDNHADAYYLARQETLVAEPDRLRQWADDAARFAAAGLAGRHFPGLVADDYAQRFASLAAELRVRYGVDAEPSWGHPLDGLDASLAELLRQRLAERCEQLGTAQFGELARLLLLQAGDELWENYRANLKGMAAVSRVEGQWPKTAVAEYVIESNAAWQRFREAVSDRFLSQMCHFPIAVLTDPPQAGSAQSSPVAVDPRLAQLAS